MADCIHEGKYDIQYLDYKVLIDYLTGIGCPYLEPQKEAVVDITAKGKFVGEKPSSELIKESFSGKSDIVGFSLMWLGVTGSESENFITNIGTFEFSIGVLFSYGLEQSYTMERK